MPLILGLDTGGSFTDAALVDEAGKLVAHAKAATTPHDLSLGIGAAITRILTPLPPQQKSAISRVALSTTLATNAVVEGTATPVGLVLIGFEADFIGRLGLPSSAPNTPHAFIKGGHHSDGGEQAPLDTASVARFVNETKSKVAGYAIAGYFATRNAAHEVAAGEVVAKHAAGLPVTLSHALSSSLGGVKRAATALLNARLIGLLTQQIKACEGILAAADITADLMLVKGDGSLVAAEFARLRPIETLLSGPAASIAGATHLIKSEGEGKAKGGAKGGAKAGVRDGIVCDIGGTTTDIAVMADGLPRLSPDGTGARIGGWATMVEAVECHTYGIGGDSEVKVAVRESSGSQESSSKPRLTIGPRRVIPLCVLAETQPDIHEVLDQQLQKPIASPSDGRFILPQPLLYEAGLPSWLSKSEAKLAEACRDYLKAREGGDDKHRSKSQSKNQGRAIPIAEVATTRLTTAAIARLHAHGLIRLAGFTPTDAVHVLGEWEAYDVVAAKKSAGLMARQKIAKGKVAAQSPQALAHATIHHWVMQSALAVYDSACAYLGKPHAQSAHNPIIAEMLQARLDGVSDFDLIKGSIALTQPLIALGGGAGYYHKVAAVLATRLIIPPYAEVAAAVGAAVSSICQRVSVTITQPEDDVFRLHVAGGSPEDFGAIDQAIARGEVEASRLAKAKAMSAGAAAKSVVVSVAHKKNMVRVGSNRELFIQAVIEATATAAGVV